MDVLKHLNSINPETHIMEITNQAFLKYGRVQVLDCASGLLELAADSIPMPVENVVYKPSNGILEGVKEAAAEISMKIYGGMPVQIGYCCGYNDALNAFEYHKGSELIMAATDTVLLLSEFKNLKEDSGFEVNSASTEVFYVEKGTCVELFSGVLHFTPVQVDEGGFLTIVVLPKGTNYPLPEESAKLGKSQLLVAVNKWLITHPELPYGYHGITGVNIKIAL